MGIKEAIHHEVEKNHHTSNQEETHQSDLPGQGVPGLSPVPALYEAPPRSGVSLEEYMFYAQVQREQENLYGAAGVAVEPNAPHGAGYLADANEKHGSSEKVSQNSAWVEAGGVKPQVNNTDASTFDQLDGLSDIEKESRNAHRAIKTASWVAVFYLITTDILGPYGAPYAMSQNGWVTGNVMYIVMGFCAWWCGIILWKLFMQLDSARYPIKTYGDLGERVVGYPMRWTFNALQTLQLIINVGLICLTNGQALSQIITGAPGNAHLCFSVCVVIFSLVGMAFAQVQTFRGLGVAASTAVYQNIAIVVVSMAAIIKYGPYIAGAQASYGSDYPYNNQPVITKKFVSYPISQKVNGIMNMVFAYGGAMIFPELMAEMRRPMDFWKGMISAQALICTVYLVYANVVYAYQGQYVLGQSYNGIAKYSFQTVCNLLAILSGTIAAALYGNVGLKVIYVNTVQSFLKGPALNSSRGRMIWTMISVGYWALAFVIASSIPQVQTISGLIAAIAIMNFSYSFPFMLALIFYIKRDAMVGDTPYAPGQPAQRQDTWAQWSRWQRGLFGGHYQLGTVVIPGIVVKVVLLIVTLGSYTLSGLGMYGSGESIKETFQSSAAATSFGCAAPV
ncbi:related to neutral amino acid permease [Melanopsichium pennsylvanicum]|uniref:Related to neutral amino acid permease n=2 Tax=Melanopsichium pennsylvanicum TaxID=63383 RepID=A0AAJ4XST6_9BASI|nr:related to neutral amino acid permease [Melanopsichium pennsylvanicum 4]SNX87222.1 related to neutral amino acid permease [Melanopsichium pennsylvanicum]